MARLADTSFCQQLFQVNTGIAALAEGSTGPRLSVVAGPIPSIGSSLGVIDHRSSTDTLTIDRWEVGTAIAATATNCLFRVSSVGTGVSINI